MEMTEAVKAKIETLQSNLNTLITDLQPKIKALEAEGKGVAELKEQANKLIQENTKLHDEIKAITDRIDGIETDAQKRGSFAFGAGVGAQIEEGFKSITSQTRDRVSVEFNAEAYMSGRKDITNLPASAGPLLVSDYLPGIQGPGVPRLTVRDLVMPGQTSAASVTFMRELAVTNNAGYQLTQGATKGKSDFVFEQVTKQVATIAHYVKASRQMMDDVAALRSYIEGRMRFLLDQKFDAEILNGAGTSGTIDGINTQADAFDATLDAALGLPDTGAHILDVLGVAAYQVSLSDFFADGFVLNPREAWALRLLKDGNERYLFGDPNTGSPNMRPWGIPIVESKAQAVDTFTAGAFRAGAQLFMRENAIARLSTENEDDFINNLVTLLVELRAVLAVYRPSAFVTGTFTAAAA